MNNHRLSLKKKLNQLNLFHGDSESFFCYQTMGTFTNLFYTNFVCSPEFLHDSSIPPTNLTKLRKLRPKEISFYIYLSIYADTPFKSTTICSWLLCSLFSTYKLIHIKDFKVIDVIIAWICFLGLIFHYEFL